ncbi:MAG TPA: tRNA epoxyqueuosine(34) reductase QueG [Edaphobacter sp.]|nr:tRNA epoxyqueuosine(34) reductase QueG [Edaphobacter sp.]
MDQQNPGAPLEWTEGLTAWIEEEAFRAGFDAASVASIPEQDGELESRDAARFSEWIQTGCAGEMEYLKRTDDNGQLLRSGVRAAFPWARSVLVCAWNYNVLSPVSTDPVPGSGWIARYAWMGQRAENGDTLPTDYHEELLRRLRMLEAMIRERAPADTRCYVDTGPIVERAVAAKAGLGWIGKNTCLIHPKLGSWLLLGVIVTSVPVTASAHPRIAPDRCGSCTRCLDACPTQALIAPGQMDASRCISYLTIEKKGSIAPELREPMGRQVFGCDICQEVCPWNRRAPIVVKQGIYPRPELVNPALTWLAAMDNQEFRRNFRGSPLERTRRKRLHRNVAIAMGNSASTSFLPQLEIWSKSEDKVLAETAEWAIKQILDANQGYRNGLYEAQPAKNSFPQGG